MFSRGNPRLISRTLHSNSPATAYYLTHPPSSSFTDALAWYDAIFFVMFFNFSFSSFPLETRAAPARCLRQGCVAMAGIYVSHDDLGVGEAWYSLGRDRPRVQLG